MSEQTLDLNVVLSRVRALIEKAEHQIAPGATEAERASSEQEQRTAREMADALMLKYQIQEAMLDKNRPAASKSKPAVIEVELTGEYELISYVAQLLSDIARLCRCRVRHYTSHDQFTWKSKVYGFESDLRYLEMLYTTLRLHMVGALKPKVDPSKSLGENAYVLHSAGKTWIEVAEMYGYHRTAKEPGDKYDMFRNRDGERRAMGYDLIVAYRKEVKRRGETPIKVPSGEAFRRSAAQGYANRISQRLRETEQHREQGAELVLRTRIDDVNELFKQMNPDLFTKVAYEECEACKRAASGTCRAHKMPKLRYIPLNEQAYASGVRHANSASLNPAAGSSTKKGIS